MFDDHSTYLGKTIFDDQIIHRVMIQQGYDTIVLDDTKAY